MLSRRVGCSVACSGLFEAPQSDRQPKSWVVWVYCLNTSSSTTSADVALRRYAQQHTRRWMCSGPRCLLRPLRQPQLLGRQGRAGTSDRGLLQELPQEAVAKTCGVGLLCRECERGKEQQLLWAREQVASVVCASCRCCQST